MIKLVTVIAINWVALKSDLYVLQTCLRSWFVDKSSFLAVTLNETKFVIVIVMNLITLKCDLDVLQTCLRGLFVD